MSVMDQISEGAVLDGRFVLKRLIGTGMTARVYEARDENDRSVAVKVLDAPMEPREAERLSREISSAARLSSAYVVPILDHGIDTATSTAFLVMPLVHGTTLQNLLEKGPLRAEAVIRIGIQIALALDESHSKGVVHRDVKPSNVLVETQSDGRVLARLCDFGLAKPADAIGKLTATGSVLGTPLYMAPEQARDPRRADARSDLWSLGITLYHSLSGRIPLEEIKSYQQWISSLCDEDPPWLQEIAPWVDGEVARTIHGVLVRNPALRCPSAHALVSKLRSVLRGDESLSREMLSPLGQDARAVLSSRAEPPGSWGELGGSVGLSQLLGATLNGRYRLTRQVGSGGMGAVFEAEGPEGSVVAIKVIKPDQLSSSSDGVRRFVREARAAMSIEHENVVRAIEASTDSVSGLPYIVMEMLHGTDLARLLSSNGALEPSIAAWIFWRACEGLDKAHAQGMVHRDIKPANIFLHQAGDTIVPKLCDFGVAKLDLSLRDHSATTELTQTGGMLGSPLYMAPEHAENAKKADTRSDVWSMALSLYEALTGRLPWRDCTTIGELMLCLYTKEVPALQQFAPWVEPELAAIVHKGLQRDPARRFQSAGEMARALDAVAASVPAPSPQSISPLSEALRSMRAPKLDVAAITGDAVSPTPAPVPGRNTYRARVLGVAGLAVMGGIVAVAWPRTVPPPSDASPQTSAPAFASSAASSASGVADPAPIAPASASASTDGIPVSVASGEPSAAKPRPHVAGSGNKRVVTQPAPGATTGSPSVPATPATNPLQGAVVESPPF